VCENLDYQHCIELCRTYAVYCYLVPAGEIAEFLRLDVNSKLQEAFVMNTISGITATEIGGCRL
jgi:hypothetical protein